MASAIDRVAHFSLPNSAGQRMGLTWVMIGFGHASIKACPPIVTAGFSALLTCSTGKPPLAPSQAP